MNKLKLIKIIVVILTFMLVFGTLTFLTLLFKKNHLNKEILPTNINLAQPDGSYIKQINQENEKLYLLTIGGGMNDRVIIIDTNNGKTLTTITIN